MKWEFLYPERAKAGIDRGSKGPPLFLVVINEPSDEDEMNGQLMSDRRYRVFWKAVKDEGSLATTAIYTTTNDEKLPGEIEWFKAQGGKVVLLVGKEPYERCLGRDETLFKIRGSYVLKDGLIYVPTLAFSDLVRMKFERSEAQADLFFVFYNDIQKALRATQKGFRLPEERFNVEPSAADVVDFIDRGMARGALFAVDIETTSLDWYAPYGQIVMIGLATSAEDALCVPLLSGDGSPYFWNYADRQLVEGALRRLFVSGRLMFQNGMFDVPFLRAKGFHVDPLRIEHDTMLLHHAISPELPHDLGFITSLYGETGYWKNDFLQSSLPILKRDQLKVRRYNLRDCVVLHQCLPHLLRDLERTKNQRAYVENMGCVAPVIEQMETGVLFDSEQMAKVKRKLEKRLKVQLGHLKTLGHLPEAFNVNSGEHLAWFLFSETPRKLKGLEETLAEYEVPGTRKKKEIKGKPTKKYAELLALRELLEMPKLTLGKFFGHYNPDTMKVITDKQARAQLIAKVTSRLVDVRSFVRKAPAVALEERNLRRLHLWLRFFDAYQTTKKSLSTYTGFQPKSDGRLHTGIAIHGTASGRPASKAPNLLNISKKEKDIRRCFIAPKGYVIVSMDYSSIEARMGAYITGDQLFIDAVHEGNLHDVNTRNLFGVSETSPLWKQGREAAKTFQFGHIQFGGTEKSIWEKTCLKAPKLNLTFEAFQAAAERYWKYFVRFAEWRKEVETEVMATHSTTTPFGRTRFLYGPLSSQIRQGYNHPAQGGAAHVMNTVMAEAVDKVRRMRENGELDARLQLQIYDDLRWECRADQVGLLVKTVKPIMEQPFTINGVERVFPVEVEVGPNWTDLKKYTGGKVICRKRTKT